MPLLHALHLLVGFRIQDRTCQLVVYIKLATSLSMLGNLCPQLSTNTWTYRFKTALDGPAVIQSAPDRLKWVHYVVRSTTLCTRTRKNPRLQTHPTLDSENFWSCLVYEPQCPQRMGPSPPGSQRSANQARPPHWPPLGAWCPHKSAKVLLGGI